MIEQGHPADASRDASELVAREHGALRRVALLVAQGAEPAEVFAAVAAEVNRLVPVDIVHMYRYEPDGTGVAVAEWNSLSEPILEPEARRAPGGNNVRTLVLHSGRTARIDDVEEITGAPAEPARRLGVTCSVGTPIVVGGRLWGVIVSATVEGTESLPRGRRGAHRPLHRADGRGDRRRAGARRAHAARRLAGGAAAGGHAGGSGGRAERDLRRGGAGGGAAAARRRDPPGPLRAGRERDRGGLERRGRGRSRWARGCRSRRTASPISCAAAADRRGSTTTRAGRGRPPTSPAA